MFYFLSYIYVCIYNVYNVCVLFLLQCTSRAKGLN